MLRRPLFYCFLYLVTLVSVSSAATKPNVILITLDSTRADRMDFLGSSKGLSPNLDTLARQSLVFEHAYSQAPLTIESLATLLTGTYPQTHRASELSVPLGTALPYLPDLLHAAGYRTAAFVGSILLDPKNGPFQGYSRGFDSYDAAFHWSQPGEDRYQSQERRGTEVVARALKWLDSHPHAPFFLWVHLQDPHAPYVSYDRAVATADAAAGKLLAALRAQKLYDDALIVVAADHGESLGNHGEQTHGFFLYDDTVRVPLVIKLPQKIAARRISNRARLLDIAPTILETAGVPAPSQMQGQSLLRIALANTQSEQSAYARTDLPQQGFNCSQLESWRAGKYLYIRAPRPELYDLSVDPAAAHNLAQSAHATLDTLAGQLQAFDNHFTKDGNAAASSGLSSSQVQQLASLGYIGVTRSNNGVQTAATGVDPKDVIAAANQTLAAVSALADGKPEKTTLALRPVLKDHPDLYLAQYTMGFALAQQKKYADAVACLHKAIELRPDSAWAHYQMGLSLLKTGDFKTSALHLEIATERLPAFAAAHTALADAYSHLARNEDANRERNRAQQ